MNTSLKIIFLVVISALLSGCFLTKIPNVNSYRSMPSRVIEKPNELSPIATNFQPLGDLKISPKRKKQSLEEFLEKSNTTVFLVLKKNQLIYEWYADDSLMNTPLTSFSVAKSILSALVGIAIEEGKINSEQDQVIRYVKNLDTTVFSQLKILHLLQMTSGIRYTEVGVFNDTNAYISLKEKNLRFKPAQKFEYWSATYQLLGMVLQEAIAPQSISDYLTEKIWQPMGAESKASWSIDHEGGIEKTFCCVQAKPIDYARFGSIYLNEGKFNNQQIVPKEWVEKSITMNEKEGSVKKYNYGWWLPFENENEFLARGFRGQRIFMNQEKETVIVRLGENRAGLFGFKWSKFLSSLNNKL